MHTYSSNESKNVYSVKTKKSISPLPIVIAVIAVFILIAKFIPVSTGASNGNGILPDEITADTQLFPTEEPNKRLVVLSVKNTSYKPITDLYCTFSVADNDGSITYNETLKVCEVLNSKEETEFQHIITVPTDNACTVHSQCRYKTRII